MSDIVYDQNYKGIQGVNIPPDGAVFYQQDFMKEQEDIGGEIIDRESDYLTVGIIEGFAVTVSATAGCVDIASGKARDPLGRRINTNALTAQAVPDLQTTILAVNHVWIMEPYILDGTNVTKYRRRHSSSIGFYTAGNVPANAVQIYRVQRSGNTVTLLEDLRVFSVIFLPGTNDDVKSYIDDKIANHDSQHDDRYYMKSEISNMIQPVGSIIAYLPGYFTAAGNSGYTAVALTLSSNWKVCDGSLCNDASSPIFNGAGRYLPNLTDSRFIMGSTIAGAGTIGGNSANQVTLSTSNMPSHNHTNTHTHTLVHTHQFSGTTGTISADHTHSVYIVEGYGGGNVYISSRSTLSSTQANWTTSGASANHTHQFSGTTVEGSTATTSDASANTGYSGSGTAFSILPKYLSCAYIMRIK